MGRCRTAEKLERWACLGQGDLLALLGGDAPVCSNVGAKHSQQDKVRKVQHACSHID